MVRALDCDCSRPLVAANDNDLFQQALEHVDRDHPEMELGDTQVHEVEPSKIGEEGVIK
jgi:hypothetical protein